MPGHSLAVHSTIERPTAQDTGFLRQGGERGYRAQQKPDLNARDSHKTRSPQDSQITKRECQEP